MFRNKCYKDKKEEIRWVNSIFTKTLIVFLFVMIPMYFLGLRIFDLSRDMLRDELFNSMKSQVTNYLNDLDNDIKRIKKLQYDCFTDEDLNSLAYANELMSDYDKSKAINRIRNRITSIIGITGTVLLNHLK